MQIYFLTILWMIIIMSGTLWAIYHRPTNKFDNNKPKVVFDLDSDKRHSVSSIESLEHSDNEGIRRKNIQKLKYKVKTCWPSKTSIKRRPYKSF